MTVCNSCTPHKYFFKFSVESDVAFVFYKHVLLYHTADRPLYKLEYYWIFDICFVQVQRLFHQTNKSKKKEVMGKFPKLKGVTICDCFFFSPNYSSKLQEIKRKLYNTQQHSIFQDTVPKLLLFLVLFSHTDLTLANHIGNANVHVCNHWCYNISLFTYSLPTHNTILFHQYISSHQESTSFHVLWWENQKIWT